MIQANELRIGNLIEMDGMPLTVTSITNEYVGVNEGFLLDIFAKGIPITVEWLLKSGFGKKENDAWFRLCAEESPCPISFSINITKSGICHICIEQGNSGQGMTIKQAYEIQMDHSDMPDSAFILENSIIVLNPIQYVHQLQNLYFTLTGTELNLKQ